MNSLCVCDAYGMCPAGCRHCDVCAAEEVMPSEPAILPNRVTRASDEEARDDKSQPKPPTTKGKPGPILIPARPGGR